MGSIFTDKETIFRSKLPDIYIPDHLPLHSYCFENMHNISGNHLCLIDGNSGNTFTYSEVYDTSRKVAYGLHSLGVNQGDVIMLLLPNTPEFVFSFLAASFLGAMSTTANPYYMPAEIHKQAVASKARLVVTESCYVSKLKDVENVKVVVIDEHFPENCIHFSQLITSGNEYSLPKVDIKPDDVVALPYSSGTTGLPKGVMLTHRGQVTSVAQQVDGENPNLHFKKEDVIVCLLPLFHIYSLNSVLLCGLRAGASIVLMKKFEVAKFMELVEKYRVTIAPLVPPIVVDMVKNKEVLDKYDLSSVRIIMSGAAPMGKELEERLREKMPKAKLGQGYGMTEAGPVLSMCLAFAKEPFDVKSGSCGTVVRNAELKIIDPDSGISLYKNQPGEICIRGHQIMKGYLNNQEATEQTIDNDGWLHTGDVGYVDYDDEIFIVDRLKELIKYKGFQVAPAELEAMLIAHPNIADAAVVSMKDDRAGEVPVAFVVQSDGSMITEDEIKQYISKQVVFYKRIYKVFFCKSIPKAPSGKILRKELRAKLTAEYPNGYQP